MKLRDLSPAEVARVKPFFDRLQYLQREVDAEQRGLQAILGLIEPAFEQGTAVYRDGAFWLDDDAKLAHDE